MGLCWCLSMNLRVFYTWIWHLWRVRMVISCQTVVVGQSFQESIIIRSRQRRSNLRSYLHTAVIRWRDLGVLVKWQCCTNVSLLSLTNAGKKITKCSYKFKIKNSRNWFNSQILAITHFKDTNLSATIQSIYTSQLFLAIDPVIFSILRLSKI